jgi:hypothetical protein
MATLLATLLIIGLIMTAMAVGVMFQGKALKGSCGGTGNGCPCTDEEQRACAAKRREAA